MRQTFTPLLTRPPDFDRFWGDTLHALDEIDPDVVATPLLVDPVGLELSLLSFRSFGGVRVSMYLASWRDHQPRPLVIHSHGYRDDGPEIQMDWARAGLNVAGVDIRGYGRSRGALPRPSAWGWALTGLSAPETSVLRGAVCDFLRAVTLARQRLDGHAARTVVHGQSFAGGLAVMAEGLRPQGDLLALAVPTLGWAEGRLFFVKGGSGLEIARYLDRFPECSEDVMGTLRYFDPINFAGRVACPTLVGVGLVDSITPPETVYPIANHLRVPREVLEFAVSHSKRPEERLWVYFDARWIELALRGVPPDFGLRGPYRVGPDSVGPDPRRAMSAG